MLDYKTSLDICNRALQHTGTPGMDPTLGFSDGSRGATETQFVYDKLRKAELRRNDWKFAIRWAPLRAMSTTTRVLDPSAWSDATAYRTGAIVEDSTGSLWIANQPNTNKTPGTDVEWELYFGPLTVDEYDSATDYYAGELVYVADGDGGYDVFLSLVNENDEDPETAADYDSTATYAKGDLVDVSGTVYVSIVDLNTGNAPASSPSQWSTTTGTRGTGSAKWQPIDAVLKQPFLVWPIGAGPANTYGKHIFKLPANYLRTPPQTPKQGAITFLGAPGNARARDWVYERDYLISFESVIVFRFVADVTDVKLMDSCFCEGLACRVAYEVSEVLTQSASKKQAIASEYAKFMGEARVTNAIECGPTQPDEDEWIATRV